MVTSAREWAVTQTSGQLRCPPAAETDHSRGEVTTRERYPVVLRIQAVCRQQVMQRFDGCLTVPVCAELAVLVRMEQAVRSGSNVPDDYCAVCMPSAEMSALVCFAPSMVWPMLACVSASCE